MLHDVKITAEQARTLAQWAAPAQAPVLLRVEDPVLVAAQGDERIVIDSDGCICRDVSDAEALEERIGDAVSAADDAFWRVIADAFPEIRTGDFGPEETQRWTAAMRDAVETWLRNNGPDPESAPR